MKHVFYGSQVLAVSDRLAEVLTHAVADFASAEISRVLPIACYMDDREMTAEILIGPSVPIMIAETYLPDNRQPARNDEESITYILNEIDSLEREQMEDM